jgi:hypothetical protein
VELTSHIKSTEIQETGRFLIPALKFRSIVELSEKLCWLKPFIYTGNVDLTKVLPYRANIAWINYMDRHMCLIWFDDGSLDCLKSLGEIIDNIDWVKNSKEFDL